MTRLRARPRATGRKLFLKLALTSGIMVAVLDRISVVLAVQLGRRPILAGVLFGPLTIKPHLGLLIPRRAGHPVGNMSRGVEQVPLAIG